MATSSYLGSYSISNSRETFELKFDIPDNCSFLSTEEPLGNYTITVFLNPTIKKPSKIFVTKTIAIACDVNNNLEVGFLLPEEAGTIGLAKKPKLSINA